MKSLRIWIVLLLAVLLPVRGALAAAMQCDWPGSSVPAQSQPIEHGHADHHPAAHAADYAHDHGHGDGQAAQPAADGHSDGGAHEHASSSAQCNLCCATCSATALPSATMAALAPAQALPAVFPQFHALAPSFVSGGPERPPRSI